MNNLGFNLKSKTNYNFNCFYNLHFFNLKVLKFAMCYKLFFYVIKN